jgi:hypothetical protein
MPILCKIAATIGIIGCLLVMFGMTFHMFGNLYTAELFAQAGVFNWCVAVVIFCAQFIKDIWRKH